MNRKLYMVLASIITLVLICLLWFTPSDEPSFSEKVAEVRSTDGPANMSRRVSKPRTVVPTLELNVNKRIEQKVTVEEGVRLMARSGRLKELSRMQMDQLEQEAVNRADPNDGTMPSLEQIRAMRAAGVIIQ